MLSAAQLVEWEAYQQVEPFGEHVEWLRHGIRCMVAANPNRKKGAAPFKPEDFMPDPPEKKVAKVRKQTPEEMKAIILAAAGGRIRVRRRDGR